MTGHKTYAAALGAAVRERDFRADRARRAKEVNALAAEAGEWRRMRAAMSGGASTGSRDSGSHVTRAEGISRLMAGGMSARAAMDRAGGGTRLERGGADR